MDVLKGRGTGKGRLTNMKLIVAINVVAGLGIFFSGYDQGVMAGVNVSPDYLVCKFSNDQRHMIAAYHHRISM